MNEIKQTLQQDADALLKRLQQSRKNGTGVTLGVSDVGVLCEHIAALETKILEPKLLLTCAQLKEAYSYGSPDGTPEQDEIEQLKSQNHYLEEINSDLSHSLVLLKEKLARVESGEFVLVPKSKIDVLWQDDDEPENFVSKESDLEVLGDELELNDIITIKKHYQACISTETLYGTWISEHGYPSKNAKFHVGTHAECMAIVEKNKAMIEAQGDGDE